MKPLLGDSEQDGNLLLGGLGSAKSGGAGRVAGAASLLRKARVASYVLSGSSKPRYAEFQPPGGAPPRKAV